MQNNANINFGVNGSGSPVTITHYRILYGASGSMEELVPWRALTASQALPDGNQLRFPPNQLDVVFKAGQLGNAGLKRFVDAAITDSTEGWQVQAGTASGTVATYSGYSNQNVPANGWATSTEAD